MINIFETTIENILPLESEIPEFDSGYILKNLGKLENKESLILIAKIDDNPAGFAIRYDRYNDGSLYAWILGVLPQYRQQGVMTALFNYTYDWAKEHNYKSIKVKTQNFRRPMLHALIKEGFNFLEVEDNEDINKAKILLEKIL
jgi:GNAT superfamily N-acetyltransferase